jgi:transposase
LEVKVRIVEAIGPGVTSVKVGDRVTIPFGTFTWSEKVLAPARGLFVVPPSVDAKTALKAAEIDKARREPGFTSCWLKSMKSSASRMPKRPNSRNVVANAQHVKKVPGRKTDVKDAEWLADLLCHGLLRPSFVPPKPICELRDMTRYRRKLVQSQAAERNRLLKLLESANIKLASVASDVFGVSGRLMLRALIEGKASPREMAELAKKKLRSKIPKLEMALEGRIEEHHRFLLKLQLDRLESVEKDLEVLERRIQQKLEPYAVQLALLDEIPGVDWTLAAVIVAELGVDMSVFESVSGAGLLGRSVPGEQRICRQAQEQPHSQGQCVPKNCLSGGRQLRRQG